VAWERVGAGGCGTLSARVLSCYLYDSGRGWLEGARAVVREKSRSDKGVASKVAPFRGGSGLQGRGGRGGRAGRKEGDT